MLKFDWLCQHSGRRKKNLAHVTRRIFPSLPPPPSLTRMRTRKNTAGLRDYPSPWRLYSQDSVRACGRQETNIGSCDSVQFSPNGYEYTQVCGRIIGYQFATPGILAPNNNIDEPYVDGVSLTYGAPRQHIWTLYGEIYQAGCCGDYTEPTFVDNNYFCDTGNPHGNFQGYILFPDSPLWDGISGCDDASCCAPHSGPWFNTTLTAPTTDDIEIRICANQPTTDEDTPLELVEIYVK